MTTEGQNATAGVRNGVLFERSGPIVIRKARCERGFDVSAKPPSETANAEHAEHAEHAEQESSKLHVTGNMCSMCCVHILARSQTGLGVVIWTTYKNVSLPQVRWACVIAGVRLTYIAGVESTAIMQREQQRCSNREGERERPSSFWWSLKILSLETELRHISE